ncbi:MAG TPA: hypothetical protein VKP69_34055 [Isosphaeraceae bacterium]|nr:hypothetical protein [Isosphaeraceae bacterium]
MFAFLMQDLDDRAASQQILVSGVLADVGAASPGGLITHLITDRVAEMLGDGELMGRPPGTRRRDLHRAIMVVTDSGPWDGNFTEGGLESKGSCPPALNATTAFAAPTLEEQFLVGLLDEDLEEPALDFETCLMDEGLNLVGEMLVLVGQGHGHLQSEFQCERLIVAVDGAEGDGSLKAVRIRHGEAPYWHYGVHRACFPRSG